MQRVGLHKLVLEDNVIRDRVWGHEDRDRLILCHTHPCRLIEEVCKVIHWAISAGGGR